MYNIHCALVFSLRVVLGTVGTSSGRRVTTAGAYNKTTMTLSRPRVVEHTITDDHLPRQARDKHGPQNAYQPTNKPTNKLTSYLGRRFAQVITAPDLLMLIAVRKCRFVRRLCNR